MNHDTNGFGEFRIPSGRVWDGSPTPLSASGDSTNDQGCLAIARHPDGRVMLADTKLPLDGQQPIVLLPGEWADVVDGIKSGRI
ncbi:hypothetical protein [Micromonospora haikouensis]|uniref:hypothetical protein n=1 Tax=Micromonospora haikouensis TaxID=686309 RepID=UPI003D71A4C7